MPVDYGLGGGRRKRRGSPALWIAALIGVAVVGAVLSVSWGRRQQLATATAEKWDITGPPCPSLSAAAFQAQHYLAEKIMTYDGMSIGRHSGNVSCTEVAYKGGRSLFKYPVCQFTSPSALTVKVGDQAAYYALNGRPATLSLQHGKLGCVMASKVTLFNDPT